MDKRCKALNEKGEPCQQAPITDSELCFWHDPAFEAQAAQAHRAGGLARAREYALRYIHGIDVLDSYQSIQRLIDFATAELMALDNSVARNRALLAAASTASSLLTTGELAEKLERIRSVLEPRQKPDDKKRGWLR